MYQLVYVDENNGVGVGVGVDDGSETVLYSLHITKQHSTAKAGAKSQILCRTVSAVFFHSHILYISKFEQRNAVAHSM